MDILSSWAVLKPRFNVHAARVADLQWDVLTPGVSLTQETQETEKKRVGQERTVLCLLRLDQEEWCAEVKFLKVWLVSD